MPDLMDHLQDLEARECEARQHLGRLPDAPATPCLDRECTDCSDSIDPRRLRAVPHAMRCTACEELANRKHRFAGGA